MNPRHIGYRLMTTRWLIGLASGSSADGVDAALLEAEGVGLDLQARPLEVLQWPYPHDLRELLLRFGAPGAVEVKQVSLLHRVLGETFAAAVRAVADRAHFSLQRVQVIGCPGHTLCHEADGRFPSALGLGMAAVVAERTGVTTVSDFRTRDLAAGGQGVPLGALADYLTFRHPEENRVLLHLGGIARVVFLPAGGRVQEVRGFEVGPCNLLLDGLMRRFTAGRETCDTGGKHAVQGRCLEALLQRWLGHPYLQRRPPKGIPRHGFAEEFIGPAAQAARQMHWDFHDVLCTATHFIARSIRQAAARFLPEGRPPHRVLLSGGGVRNGLLLHLLQQQFAGIPLGKTAACGVPVEAHKPLTFGVLAALTVDGVPASVPGATGAGGARLLGSLTPGSSVNWARCLAWMAAQTAPLVMAYDG